LPGSSAVLGSARDRTEFRARFRYGDRPGKAQCLQLCDAAVEVELHFDIQIFVKSLATSEIPETIDPFA
jgi:hypothetical protein